MSWNKSFIIILSVEKPVYDEYFKELHYSRGDNTDFNSISNKNKSIMSVGYIDGSIFITAPAYVDELYSAKTSSFEKWLIKKYPNKVILSLDEDGTSGFYGLCYIHKSQRVRVISGCEDEIDYSFGNPLKIEKLLEAEVLDEMSDEEKKEFLEDGQEALDEFILSESRWRLPYSFLERVWGVDIERFCDINPKFVKYVKTK